MPSLSETTWLTQVQPERGCISFSSLLTFPEISAVPVPAPSQAQGPRWPGQHTAHVVWELAPWAWLGVRRGAFQVRLPSDTRAPTWV